MKKSPQAPKEPDYAFEIEFYEHILQGNPKDRQVVELLGGLYTKVGRIDDGLKMDRKLVRLMPDNPVAHYNLACSLALKGRKKDSVEALETAIAKGYEDFDWLLKDEDLYSLGDYQPFLDLLERHGIAPLDEDDEPDLFEEEDEDDNEEEPPFGQD